MTSRFSPFLGHWLYTLAGDDDHLYRAIPPRDERFMDVISSTPGFQPFTRTDHVLEVGPHRRCSVVQIPRLPFQVRIQELPRAAAMRTVVFLIDLAIACHARGCTPWDVHEGNVLWWDRPRFVDFDALRPLNHANAALTFVRIGYLMYRYVFRRALPGHEKFDFGALERQGGWMAAQVRRPDFTDPAIWRDLRTVLGAVVPPSAAETHWSAEYGSGDIKELASNPKIAKVLEILPSGRTLLDVGCNKGYLSRLLEERFDAMLGFDSDEACIDFATRSAASGSNFANFGLEHLELVEPIPICERFHADVVVALAITHHLSNAGVSTPRVASILAKLTRKHLLVEDIVDVRTYHAEFKRHGLRVEQHVPSHPAGRMLTLWSR